MIFIAVGTQKFQFNRLLMLLDDWIETSGYKGEVYAQIGNSDYLPKHYNYSRFLEKAEFQNYIRRCDFMITHSGVATIIAGLNMNKPVIVVPRLKKYGEHVDDHQLQIAKNFSEQNYVLMYTENTDFVSLIKEIKDHKFSKYESRQQNALDVINDYLSKL